MRIGQGRDIHRLVEGKKLIIGGVLVPHTKGSLAHSDGDVLCHAIIDALFGSLSLGDIGQHFPDTDDKYLGADSRFLLREAVKIITDKGYKIINIDSTVSLQIPKLNPHIPNIVTNLISDLNIERDQLSVKAKTNEKLDAVGNDEAVTADVVLLLEKA